MDKTTKTFSLYLDLDGVFADFNKRVEDLAGEPAYRLPSKRLWQVVHTDPEFFLNLELVPGADRLWSYVKQYNPIFLTGAPSSTSFREQKAEWVRQKFGPEWQTIVLPKKEKQNYSGWNKILIDDSLINIEQWTSKGGYGILHEDADKTIVALEELISFI